MDLSDNPDPDNVVNPVKTLSNLQIKEGIVYYQKLLDDDTKFKEEQAEKEKAAKEAGKSIYIRDGLDKNQISSNSYY